jgi:CRISPR-associated protein (TIGR03984 family)
MSETKLLIYKAQVLSLADAINAFVKTFDEREKHYALLYAPQRCHLALIDATGKATEADKNGSLQGVTLQGVFEGRIFNSQAELRWLNVPDGVSDVAIVTEEDSLRFEGFKLEPKEAIVGKIESFPGQKPNDRSDRKKENEKERPHGYLLWGEGTGKYKGGWSQMATARIGAYYVPIDEVEHKDRVQLAAVEYLKKYDYGNLGVCEERLIGLRLIDRRQPAIQIANQEQAEEAKANE